jgi:hypothetical protein
MISGSKTESLAVIRLVVILLTVAVFAGCSEQPRPARLTIHITGNIRGHIKNCGCASGQYGGLLRMARLAKAEQLTAAKPQGKDKGRPAVAMLIDMGNFADPASSVSRLTSKGVVMGMGEMGYSAVGLGKYDLSFSQAELWDMFKDSNLPLTAANLDFIKPPSGEDRSTELNRLIESYRVIELGEDYRVGVIHIIDDNAQQTVGELNGFKLQKADVAVKKVLEAHLNEADYWVLTIADTSAKGTGPQTIAALTDLDLVVGFNGNNPLKPADSTEVVLPYFIDPPYLKAKDVMQAEVSFPQGKADPVIQTRRLAIPETIKADSKVQGIVDLIDESLEFLENEEAERRMQAEIVHPVYVGYESCRQCHGEIVEQHLKTAHATALRSLVEVGQQTSAACLPCHVQGHGGLPGVSWSGGWNIIDDQGNMRGVHCESCHGPGEYHLAVISAQTSGQNLPDEIAAELSKDGRNKVGLLSVGKESCLVCHDAENSPKFDYSEYWQSIKH